MSGIEESSARQAALRQMFGSEIGLGFTATDIERHMRDHSGLPVKDVTVRGVVYPKSVEEVSAVLRVCHAEGVAVVPQGGLTGMAGGAQPSEGCVILSMERMREIEEVDLNASTMTVQAGVPLEVVQKRAAEEGLFFPLDLGARGSSLIGGNIATNAGGNRVLRYGMMRELVLGLEVVLANGTVIRSLSKVLKNNTGFDIKHFFIGSEGTLGVITRAVLRLWPASRRTAVALCGAQTYADVLQILRLARERLGGTLSAFEVMWREFYSVVMSSRSGPMPLSTNHEFYVLIEMQGSDELDDQRFGQFVESLFEKGCLGDATIAQSLSEVNSIWAIRDSSGELGRIWGESSNFDVSVPTGDIDRFAVDCRSRVAVAVPGAETLVFGHIADSNVHICCRAPDPKGSAKTVEREIYRCVRDWKGSVSAEHGIGLSKREYLSYSRSPAEISLMRAIKAALDPSNILNPGKVLPAGMGDR